MQLIPTLIAPLAIIAIILAVTLLVSPDYLWLVVRRVRRFIKGGKFGESRKAAREEKRVEKKGLRIKKLKNKRVESRIRKGEQRFAMLSAMTKEDRVAFIKAERDKEAMIEDGLHAAMENGLVSIAVDLSFDQTSDKEFNSLAKQLSSCYSYSKSLIGDRGCTGMTLHVVNYSSPLLVKPIEGQGGAHWIMHKHSADLHSVFESRRGDLVYLSPDAELPLEEVTSDKIYVIGGIIDRTIAKGMTLSRSSALDIPARRLPLQEKLPDSDSFVLNIDTVVKILAEYVVQGSWESAFEEAVPKRKRRKDEHVGTKDLPLVTSFEQLLALGYEKVKKFNFRGVVSTQCKRQHWPEPEVKYDEYEEETVMWHRASMSMAIPVGRMQVQFSDVAVGRTRKEALALVSWKLLEWFKFHGVFIEGPDTNEEIDKA